MRTWSFTTLDMRTWFYVRARTYAEARGMIDYAGRLYIFDIGPEDPEESV